MFLRRDDTGENAGKAGFTTHLKLGASTQALTQIILHVGWLRVMINMFPTYRVWCEWVKYPGIRALVSLSAVKKF